jgi:hypothetical protein
MTLVMMRYRALAALVAVAALSSCDKNAVQDITGSLPASQIRFFHFGVNAPGVNFYANNTKMTAISSTTGTESTTGVVYGGVGSGGLYAGIEPGQYTFSGKIAAATDKDLAISNVQATLEAGKRYSFYQSGIYDATAKTVDAFIVEDPYNEGFEYAVAYVRFVNAISNSNPMTLYVTNTTAGSPEIAIGGAIAYKAASAFVAIPGGAYNLATRNTGSPTNVIARTGVSFSPGRIYTVTSRGDVTASATSANRPMLDNTANR